MFLVFIFLNFAFLSASEDTVVNNLHEQKYAKAMLLLKQAYSLLEELKSEVYEVDFIQVLNDFKLKKYKQAKILLLKLIKKNGEKIEYLYILAECLFRSGEIEKSIVIYNKLINSVSSECLYWNDQMLQQIKKSYIKLAQYFEKFKRIADLKALLQKYVNLFQHEANDIYLVQLCEKYGIKKNINQV